MEVLLLNTHSSEVARSLVSDDMQGLFDLILESQKVSVDGVAHGEGQSHGKEVAAGNKFEASPSRAPYLICQMYCNFELFLGQYYKIYGRFQCKIIGKETCRGKKIVLWLYWNIESIEVIDAYK